MSCEITSPEAVRTAEVKDFVINGKSSMLFWYDFQSLAAQCGRFLRDGLDGSNRGESSLVSDKCVTSHGLIFAFEFTFYFLYKSGISQECEIY